MSGSKVISIHTGTKQPAKMDWVFMDAGDTFIYGYPTFYQAIRDCCLEHQQNFELDRVEEAVRASIKEMPRSDFSDQETFTFYFRSLYRNVLQSLNYAGNIEMGVNYLWNEWETGRRLRLFDDTLQALRSFKDAGFKMAAISNWDTSFERTLKSLGVAEYFEFIIASCDAGVSKPDIRIFEFALQKAGVQPGDVWYLGDQIEVDIEPAKQLGLKTILVDYYGKHLENNGVADYKVSSMSVAASVILKRNI